MNSLTEQILAHLAAILIGATAAGTRVTRSRLDAFGIDELPAIDIRRTTSEFSARAQNLDHGIINFDLVFICNGPDWETAADTLHLAAHARLYAFNEFAALGRGLRCTGTDTQADSADTITGRLTAHYQIQVTTRPGDPARLIT